ncbi:predicted protein [Thalassiosira pseudonana CCMP1335]|uniref:Uncharacterized protein n=1 Tax=Thalassiosira pseudonana TaxID=35128 RepID=B8CFQ8_THAPS|nr:predicted protein [Thalassiosira pseudonana CCMP1335]EED87842.1 predicted protein [Thalassiosira pseudonana CCMP1335]
MDAEETTVAIDGVVAADETAASSQQGTDATIDDDDTTHPTEPTRDSAALISSKPTITTPSPPRWRFVAEARKKTGYSSADAGQKVDGLSAEELAKHYIPPTIETDQRQGKSITVSKLVIPEFGVSSDAQTIDRYAQTFNNEQQHSVEDLRKEAEQIRIDRDRLEEEIQLAKQQKLELDNEVRKAREEREREERETVRLLEVKKKLEDEANSVKKEREEVMGVDVATREEHDVSDDSSIKDDTDNSRKYKMWGMLALVLLVVCIAVALGVVFSNKNDGGDSSQGVRGSEDGKVVLQMSPDNTSVPTATPSLSSPTASLISHSTSSPSTNSSLSNATCRPGEAYFSVNFTFDAHPLDGIYWYVLEKCTNNMHFECKQCFEGLAPLSTEFRSGCLPDDRQFVFYFDDYSGEFWSQGGYSIFYDEETIFNSTGDVKLTQQVSFGGGGTMCSSIRYDGAVFNSIGD